MKDKIIAVINQKGGVGKTTTVINLSASLAQKEKKCMVIDLDPQGNATTGLGKSNNDEKNNIYNILIRNLNIEQGIQNSSASSISLQNLNVRCDKSISSLQELLKACYKIFKDKPPEDLKKICYDGIIVNTGLARSADLNTTVYPFILRNITLAGVDCVYADYKKRVKAWKFLEENLDKRILKKIKTTRSFNDLKKISSEILKGKIKGRTIIKVI